MNIVGGQAYELSTYLRGKIDREGSVLGWLLRARFYRADGSYIGFRDAARGYNGQSISTSWARKAGTVTAPAEAATMHIALYLYHATGWVTFDDVAVDSDAVITKYYYFNGQRIAMRKNGVLTYLHGDHLGSTVLETDTAGNATADQKYYAYGNQRDSGPVVTDHQFTGQKQDATGLVYMNARYYDPAIGSFISPDTIVPDPSLVSDYNRYLMVRGNLLKFSDPTGHEPQCDVGTSACDAEWGLWRQYQQSERYWGSFDDFKLGYNYYTQYAADPDTYVYDWLVRANRIDGDWQSSASRLALAEGYSQYVLREITPSFFDNSIPLQEAYKAAESGELSTPLMAVFIFAGLMDSPEAARYSEYWQSNAPRQSTPGTTRVDHWRISPRTGNLEQSRVIYDDYGRQSLRIDYTDHMRPNAHSNPHYHQYRYGPGYDPIMGYEVLHNID